MALASVWTPFETEVETEAESKPVLTTKEIFQKSQLWQYASERDGRKWRQAAADKCKLAKKLASFSHSGNCRDDIYPSIGKLVEQLAWPRSKVIRVSSRLVADGLVVPGALNGSGCRYRILHLEALRQTPMRPTF